MDKIKDIVDYINSKELDVIELHELELQILDMKIGKYKKNLKEQGKLNENLDKESKNEKTSNSRKHNKI